MKKWLERLAQLRNLIQRSPSSPSNTLPLDFGLGPVQAFDDITVQHPLLAARINCAAFARAVLPGLVGSTGLTGGRLPFADKSGAGGRGAGVRDQAC